MGFFRYASIVLTGATVGLASAQPNVVIFLVDDMGPVDWEHHPVFNPDGSRVYETPNMIRLARRGVTFTNGYAASPVCSPSRAAIMTGKSAANIGITDYIGADSTASGLFVASSRSWIQNTPAAEVLLSEAMLAAGYRTAFFGKWHLGQPGNPAADPLRSGFEINVGGNNAGNPGFAGGFFAGIDGAWAGMPGLSAPGVYPADAYLSDAISERAAQYIASRAVADEAFFAVVSHYVVHTPIEAPPAVVDYYTNKLAALSPQEIGGHTDATYAAMVQKMDESLGRVLDALDDPNGDGSTADSILDQTIVVFTADNGGLTSFAITSNRPFRDGKGSMYEGGIREPLIVSFSGGPGIAQGSVSSGNAIGYDIYPTILDLTGVAGDPDHNRGIDGVSLRPALEDPVGGATVLNDRDLYWHYPHRSPQAASANRPVSGGAWVSAIRRGSEKLLYFYDQRAFERYDLAADPGEQQNLHSADRTQAASMAHSLHGHLRRVGAPMPRDLGSNTEIPGSALIGPAFLPASDAEFTDDFSEAHDFIGGGVIGTNWVYLQDAHLASILNRNLTTSGSLTIRNSGPTRIVAGDISAPRLTRWVTGDFEATMHIGAMDDVDFHLVAMLVVNPDAPENELFWIGQQNRSGANDFAQARNIRGGTRTIDVGENGVFPYYRIKRRGNAFIGMLSKDGEVWIPFIEVSRPDMPDSVALSLAQAVFGSGTATATLESFQIVRANEAGITNPIGLIDARNVIASIWDDSSTVFEVIDLLHNVDGYR